MDETALYAQAQLVGAETSFTDAFGQVHRADPHALALVVETLSSDLAAHSSLCDPVIVLNSSQIGRDPEYPYSHLIEIGATVNDAVLTLHDGVTGSARARSDTVAVSRSRDTLSVILHPDLPVGCHRLEVATTRGTCLITLVCPPPSMTPQAAWVGGSAVFVPTYALWDSQTPLPSFGLLEQMARRVGESGIDLLATLPLYAAFLRDPVEPSPYSPASRMHWNEALISEHLVNPPGAHFVPIDLDQLTRRDGRYIDWPALGARRREQLLHLAATIDDATRDAVDRFVRERPDVSAFARFAAGRSTTSFDRQDLVIRSHELAQYLADHELRQIASSPGAQLALDLPVGCHPDGYERWASPELFADQMSIGAPPDLVFDGGQDWGLPPTLPIAMRDSGHRLWRDLVARAGEHAALVRIDHVMAVHRLWWIPAGMDSGRGVYVRYPREELMATIAATAAAIGTCVVGENLGTVPMEVEESMERWGMLGMYEEQFHLHEDPLPHIPARSVAGIRTHDMTPFHSHVDRNTEELLDTAIDRLLQSPAAVVQIDLDDLLGVTEPHNLPGQVLDTLWSRRLDRPLTLTLADPHLTKKLRRLGARRG
jgi:4-alpha-glucanotransferase